MVREPAAIAAEPRRPYWESWTAAFEALVATLPAPSAAPAETGSPALTVGGEWLGGAGQGG
jgi:hypothetical protein